MNEDRKHIQSRLEELRAQKLELLKQRNEEIRNHNRSNLTSLYTAPSSTTGAPDLYNPTSKNGNRIVSERLKFEKFLCKN